MMTNVVANKAGGQQHGGAVRSKSFLRNLPGMHWPGPRRSFIFSSSSNSGDSLSVSVGGGGGGSEGLSTKAKNALIDDRFDPLPNYGPTSYADRSTHPLLRRRSSSTGNLDDYGSGGVPHGLAASSNSSQSSGCSSSNGSHQHHLKALGSSSRESFRQARSVSCRTNFQNGGGDHMSQSLSCGSGWISARQRANSAGRLGAGGPASPPRNLASSRHQDDDSNDDDSYMGHQSYGDGWTTMSSPTPTSSHTHRGHKKMSNKQLMLQQQQQQQLGSFPMARRVSAGGKSTQGRTDRDSLEGGGGSDAANSRELKSGGTSARNFNSAPSSRNLANSSTGTAASTAASTRNLNGAPSSRNLNSTAPSTGNLREAAPSSRNNAAPSSRNLHNAAPSSRNLHNASPSSRNLSSASPSSRNLSNAAPSSRNLNSNNGPSEPQNKDNMKSILEDMSKKLEMAEKVRKHQQRILHQSSKRDLRHGQQTFGNTSTAAASTPAPAPALPPAQDNHHQILPPMMDLNHSARSSSKASCASSMGSPPSSPATPPRIRAQSCPDVAPISRTPSQAAVAATAAAAASEASAASNATARTPNSGPLLPVSKDSMAFSATKTTAKAAPQQDSKSIWEAFCALEEMTLMQQSKLAKLQAQMEEQRRVIAERDREINELHQERSLLKASCLKMQKVNQTSESEIAGLQRELTNSLAKVEEVELQRDEEQVRNTRLRRKLLDLANDLRQSHASTAIASRSASSPTPSIMTAQEEHDMNNIKNNSSNRSNNAGAVDLTVPASPLPNVIDKARTEFAKTA